MTTYRKKMIPDMKKPFMHFNEQGHRRGKICKTNTIYRSRVSKFLTRLQTSNSKENLYQRKRKKNQQSKGPIVIVFLLVKNNKRGSFNNLTYQLKE